MDGMGIHCIEALMDNQWKGYDDDGCNLTDGVAASATLAVTFFFLFFSSFLSVWCFAAIIPVLLWSTLTAHFFSAHPACSSVRSISVPSFRKKISINSSIWKMIR
ncbi:hypothetical protein L873DRAFT_106501 [Choiromyces venosus 120613-1]|uniref:Uncharacterized protein n=1 Tax=Choiromyces venosus 120613-1 TaxID=1336337 RepID=A0A3N4JZT8_9PEZI|nr:hypothetical protein L873DRAFT_106501 [Choiromyces venosus 120613-1]